MRTIKEILHAKRLVTEEHIKSLERDGTQGVRYTAMLPDVPFLVLGLLSDVGWLAHLIASVLFFSRNGVSHVVDYIALAALASVMFGVGYIISLNKIHEKEIATRLQKNLCFGMTVFSGLAAAVIAIVQMAVAGVSAELVWIVIGGLLNFASGLPIFLSFKKGIFYGVT